MINKRVSTTAERLQEALDAAGKRQADLVRDTGLDKSSISNYLSGAYEPKSPALGKMARALNVSDMWLWGFDVPRERPHREPAVEAEKQETQKKNDQQAQLVVRLRKDPKLFDVVVALSELPEADFDSISQLIYSLRNKQV